MTLVEVIIAAALTAGVLTTLLYFYRQVGDIGRELDIAKEENFKLRYAEARLASVFPNIVWEKDKHKDFVFFSFLDEGLGAPGSQNLIFTFNNKISLDKEFSNHVLARLFVDPRGRLILAYWPSPKRWEEQTPPRMKQEVLLEGVEKVSFDFFIPPERKEDKPGAAANEGNKSQAKGKPKEKVEEVAENKQEAAGEGEVEPEPKGDWRLQPWLKEYNKLPAMLRMIVQFKDKERAVTYIFPLSQSNAHPVYE